MVKRHATVYVDTDTQLRITTLLDEVRMLNEENLQLRAADAVSETKFKELSQEVVNLRSQLSQARVEIDRLGNEAVKRGNALARAGLTVPGSIDDADVVDSLPKFKALTEANPRLHMVLATTGFLTDLLDKYSDSLEAIQQRDDRIRQHIEDRDDIRGNVSLLTKQNLDIEKKLRKLESSTVRTLEDARHNVEMGQGDVVVAAALLRALVVYVDITKSASLMVP